MAQPELSGAPPSITDMDAARVARVAVDLPLAHLDRPFDYAIGDELVDLVKPGVRVRVRFAGRLRDGFVLSVGAASDADRELAPLQRVISEEVVLTPEVAALVRQVADHYGGTFADVVRLAVPPRHGITEKAAPPVHPAPTVERSAACLGDYPGGDGLLRLLADGGRPRAAITLAPVSEARGDWVTALVELASATLAGDRGVLLLVPDQRDLDRLSAACVARFGRGSFVTLTSEVGPAARYRAFLAVSRGSVRLVLGTRAAAFAPVHNLGLIALLDDGDDSWAEPRAPYPHAREVVALRASSQRCALAYLGYGRTAEVQDLVHRGWLASISAPAAGRRELCPVIRVAADTDRARERDPGHASRLPHDVFDAIRAGLAVGPVLLQVPRAGYLASLACARCRQSARCPRCQQPLAGTPSGPTIRPNCRWCGEQPGWQCPSCASVELRAPRVGVQRTAEELGRAFPQTRVISSSAERLVAEVADEPAIVLATPGAEPFCAQGYAAAVLLDGDQLLARPDLRAGEEALRRWLAATALVRPAVVGGTVVIVAEPSARAVQALVRLDPVGFAERELADRAAAGFPPAAALVSVEGAPGLVTEVSGRIQVPGLDRLGPTPIAGADGAVRLSLRVPRTSARTLVDAIKAEQAARSARKAEGRLRVQLDPMVL